MSKLEELRSLVSEMFKAAEEKQQIEQLSVINNTIAEVEKEQQSLMDKNTELIKSYKDLVQHTSFNDASKRPVDQISPTPVSFESALNDFMAKSQKE